MVAKRPTAMTPPKSDQTTAPGMRPPRVTSGTSAIADEAGRDVLGDLEDAVLAVAHEERDGAHGEAGERGAEARARDQRRDDVERREETSLWPGAKGCRAGS